MDNKGNKLNVLVIEDSQVDAELNVKMLRRGGYDVYYQLVETAEEMKKALESTSWDIVLSDYSMPNFTVIEALEVFHAHGVDIPFIVISGAIGEERAVEIIRAGAHDFLLKDHMTRFITVVEREIREAFNRRELIELNHALSISEQKYRSYIDNAPDGVFIVDETGKYIEVNEAGCRITGYTKDEFLRMSLSDILSTESLCMGAEQLLSFMSTGPSKADLMYRNKNGSHGWWVMETVKMSDNRFLAFAKDISQRKELEENAKIQQIELELQNEELNRAKFKAEVASKKYSDLYDLAPSGYFTLSEDKLIKELNHSGARMLGKERSQLMESSFTHFVSPGTQEVFSGFFKNVINCKAKQSCELMLVTGSGESRYVIVEGLAVGEGNQCLLNVIDITRRKQMEADVLRANSFLDLIVENIPDMIFVKDVASLNFVRVNRAGENLLGISSEEMIGKNNYDFYSTEHARKFVEQDQEVLRTLKMLDIPAESVLSKNHGIRTLHTKKVPILNADGEPEYLLSISEDITERRLAEHALKVSEEKYKTMLNASPDGILLINLKGIITEVSDIGFELLGAASREDIVGRNFLLFIPADEINTIRVIIERTMNDGLVQNIGIKIRRKNLTCFAAETSVTLIQDHNGMPVSIMVIIRDISQRRTMETKQFHADRMANLGEMASGIAHEINQPLNIISMVMDKIIFESAKSGKVDIEFLKTKSEKIFDNITRIRNIIDHIRAFSRSNNDYVLTAFDVNSSIENAVSMISEQFKHHGIRLELQLEKQLPHLQGSTYRFEQVIINLLVNAKDAVIEKKTKHPGFFDMVVAISSCQEKQFLVVEVADNGIGIKNEDINNIILPFFTTKDEGKGTGLGLSICYQIIKEMDGTIEITSDGISGTKIKLVMDLKRSNNGGSKK